MICEELKKILDSFDWTFIKGETANNFLTNIVLSRKDGNIASLYIDWNTNLVQNFQKKIDLSKFPDFSAIES